MRLIGTLEHESEARRFSAYLHRRGIENSVDPSLESDQFHYSIWIHNEDQIEEAAAEFSRFQANPKEHQFDIPITEKWETEAENPPPEAVDPEAVEMERPRKSFRGTSFFLALCCLVFFLNMMQPLSLRKEGVAEMTPVKMSLLYDVPPALETIEKILEKNKIQPIPPEVEQQIEAAEMTPFWRGAYTWILLKIKGVDTSIAEGPLFIKIRQGEFWRLFSPAILHSDLLHILFNMLWLWMLGRQIEQRIGTFRYILLTLALGVITNTAQYLMGGPFFLGYSGIVLGLAGFIWYREKKAPWEGYPLQKSVIVFLVLFILAMFALQLGSFFMLLFTNSHFTPGIANTAHIVGAITGILLARLSYFSARRPA